MGNPYDDMQDAPDAPATPVNPYDMPDGRLRASAVAASGRNPEVYAKANAIAERNGWPVEIVADSLPEFEERERFDTLDKVQQDHPAVGEFLSDPRRMALAGDDVEGMAKFADMVRNPLAREPMWKASPLPNQPKSRLDVARTIVRQERYAAEQAAAWEAEVKANPATVLDAVRSFGAAEWRGVGSAVRGVGGAWQVAYNKIVGDPISYLTGTDQTAGNIFGGAAAAISGVGEREAERTNAGFQQLRADNEIGGAVFSPSTWTLGKNPSVTGFLANGVDVLGSLAPIIVASIASGGSTAVGAGVGGTMGGGAGMEQASAAIDKMAADGTLERESSVYRELLADGVNEAAALAITKRRAEEWAFTLTAPISTLGGAATTKILNPASTLLAGRSVAAQVAGRSGLGALEESAQGVSEGVASQAGTNLGAGTSLDVFEGSFANAVLEAFGGAGPSAIAGAASGLNDKQQRARKERRERLDKLFNSLGDSTQLQAITDAAANLKLGERSAADMEAFASQVAGEGANVYLSAEAARVLFQSDYQPLQDMVGGADALAEQMALGDVVIPMGKWAAVVARLPNKDEIVRHGRMSADGLSAVELEGFNPDELLASMGLEPDTADAAERAAPGEADPLQQVRDDVQGQLIATGRYTPAAAETQAKVWSAMIGQLAEKTGQDPRALYDRYMAGINDGSNSVLQSRPFQGSAQLDALIESVRTSDSANSREIFGPSLAAWAVAQGGLQDQGGELKARDAGKLRPGLISRNGLELDRARELAVEAGYLPEGADLNAFIEAMDADLRGNAVYSEAQGSRARQDFDLARQQLLDAISDNPTLRDMPPEQFAKLTNQQIAEYVFGDESMEQAAYHGTPHNVDRFSLQKIGTGEGAQAFGWGLYFAGKREVAEHYRDRLTDSTAEIWDVRIKGESFAPNSPEGHGARLLFHNNKPEMKKLAKQMLADAKAGDAYAVDTAKQAGLDAVEYYQRVADTINNYGKRDISVSRGRLYEVDIPEDSDLIDNDAPIGKQNPKVQEMARAFLREEGYLRATENGPGQLSSAFKEMAREKGGMVKGPDGQLLYEVIAKKLGSEQAASQYFNEHGIPGLKYKAGQILGAKNAGVNYVVWDESAISDPRVLYQDAIDQTNTPEFKAWFGDSKVVDADGRPLVVYHGTDAEFNAFDPKKQQNGRWGKGFYFASNPERAKSYGKNVMPVYLRIENDKNVPSRDGFIVGADPSNRIFIVSDATQIKSATGNSGAFDPENPSILYQSPIPEASEVEQLRAKIAELEVELRTDTLTGLRNRRAFNEDEGLGWEGVMAFDMDGLTALNSISHAFGDQALQAIGDIMLASETPTARFYHTSGDEFYGRAETREEADALAQMIQDKLESVILRATVAGEDGAPRSFTYEGIGISRGTGATPDEADQRAIANKGEREAAGIRQAKGAAGPIRRLRSRRAEEAGDRRERGNNEPVRPAEAPQDGLTRKEQGIFTRALSAVRSLFQEKAEKSPRGQIQIFPDKRMSISLFEKADRSTFMHESAHFFLEVMRDLATQPDANPKLVADMGKLLEWFGVESVAQIETKHHEMFARGFERYLGEGKAPSPELQSAFSAFKAWMLSVYKALVNLNVNLTDDVRGVFDRMLASEAEIEAAQSRQNMTPLVADANEATTIGLTAKQFADYEAMLAAATEEAKAEVTAKLMKAHDRAKQKWWREELAAVTAEVEAEYEATPVFMAARILSGSKTMADGTPIPEALAGLKLDKAALVNAYGDAYLKRLGKLYRVEGGTHPDLAAAMLGFPTGEALVKALANRGDLQARVKAEAADRMRLRHGDPMTDGTLAEVAMDAVHGNKRVRLLEMELALLAKLANQAAPNRRQIVALARDLIGRKTARELRPNDYLAAERRAAQDATKAAAKGDYAAALLAKRRQAFNAAMYAEARKRQADAERKITFLKKAGTDKTRKRVGKSGKSYVEALDALMEGHELRTVSGTTVARREALRAWIARVQESGSNTSVSEELLARVESERVVNVADLTFAQLDDLHESVKNLLHLARMKNLLRTKQGQIRWKDAKRQLIERLEQQRTRGDGGGIGSADQTALQAIADLGRAAGNWVLQPETIIEWLDGGTSGPWHDILWEPSEDVEHVREALQRKVGALLQQAFDAIPAEDRKALDQTHAFEWANRPVSGHTILAALMNAGNDSNYNKLLQGGFVDGEKVRQFTPAMLEEMFATLTESQAHLVQGVWDAVNSLWPDIVALEEKMNGFAPPKVEPRGFTVMTKGGPVEMRGGYFPVKYDPRGSKVGALADDEQAKRVLAGQGPVRATTSKGHTVKRTEFTAPLLLDYHRVLSQHLDGVMGDIAYREFLPQVYRVLNDPELSRMVHARLGPGAVKALKLAFERGAVGATPLAGPLFGPFQNAADNTLTNISSAALGLRVPLALANTVTAPMLATARVSPKFVAAGFFEYYKNPRANARMVQTLSPMMLKRSEARSMDLRNVLTNLRGKYGLRRQMIELSMSVHQWIVPLAENAIWMGAYKQAQAEGADTAEAIRLADKAIRQTQTKHTMKDLATAEGNPYLRPLMQFVGPLVIVNNRLQESGPRGLRGDVTSPMQAVGVWLAMAAGGAWAFELMMGRGAEDEDDDGDVGVDDWSFWAAKKLALLPFAAYPILREATAKLDSGYSRPNPLVDAINRITKFSGTVIESGVAIFDEDEEVDTTQLVKDTAGAAGVAVGVPSNQLVRTGTYLVEVSTGEHVPTNPAAEAVYLLQGPPKDE